MTDWKTLNTRAVYSSGRWLTLEERTVQTPDGQVIEGWPWVITPDYVNVLAVTPEGKYLIFRQGKYALEGQSLAPIGGYVEEGEDPLSAGSVNCSRKLATRQAIGCISAVSGSIPTVG